MLDVVAPFLQSALADGAPALAVLTRSNWATLRAELGPSADQVSFADCDQFYVRPAYAIAAYDAMVQGYLDAGARSVSVVGELPFGPAEREWDQWTAYEATFNRALADRPASVLCIYDERALPEQLIEVAWRTHPEVQSGAPHTGSCFERPEDLVAALAPEPVALPGLRELARCDDAAGFREQLAREVAGAGVPPARVLDIVMAADEVFKNACQHAGGPEALRAGTVEGWFVCEVTDRGPGLADPMAGYLPPRPDTRPAAGLWIARQLISRLELLPAGPGLTARLWL
jgi:anti-sigma regulatory factor (Ser/Thr protein kinase)